MQALLSSITPLVEILILTVLLNYVLSFFWNTRSMDLVLGVLAFLFIFAISSWLNFPILHKMMLLIGNVAMIAVLIIFQPELRVALSRLSLKRRRYREVLEFDHFLNQLAVSVYRMSDEKIGALIVLQNEDALDNLTSKAIHLQAIFSSELLESIFAPLSPLHDGAVIIRDTTIVAAAAILPLSEDSSQLNRTMGTRHLAGLGTSQSTDATVIIVSEDSGKVSIARDGVITPGVQVDRFKGILRSVFTPPQKENLKAKISLKEWWAR